MDENETSLRDMLVRDEPMTAVDWLVDAVVALGAFGFGCLQLTLSVNLLVPDEALRRLLGIEAVVPTAYAIVAVLLTCAPLVVRRRLPWPAFAASVIVWMFFQAQVNAVSLSLIGPLVALFTLALECSRYEALAAGIASAAVLLLVPSAASSSTLASLSLVQNVAFVAAAGFAGYALQVRQAFLRAAEERAAEAERTRESEAQRRVEAERVRIAREVHDITAHSLSAVSIQAAVAERLAESDPQAAKEAIAAVRATSKSALDDIRAMIGVLRAPAGEQAETAPTAGTDQLPNLVAYLRQAGVACALDREGYDRALVPAHLDVALFGIAREACTNIVRHAHAAHASIALRTTAGYAELSVEDDGRSFDYAAARAAGAPFGHGLEGMAERAHVLGGSFSAAPRAAGGFAVRVSIPLPTKEASDHA
ncbi:MULTISPECIES: sensor histidine kinase [unclassified Adlercreutzia]|uniref:sensor histidine kinase n=1 Tax=unclassified Adlercreutzia TaxID=2636013 RepID=UPI001F1546EB|nr:MULTISPECIES: histidine kinase [unclassified Adlercreutzia]